MGTKCLHVYGGEDSEYILYEYDPDPHQAGDPQKGKFGRGAGYYAVLIPDFPAAKRAGYELDLATRGTIAVRGNVSVNHRAVPPKIAAALRASWDSM